MLGQVALLLLACAGRQVASRGAGRGDAVRGTARGEAIVGGTGDDELHGLGGDDRVQGGLGRDRLFGGEGRDLLQGGPGADTLVGGAGADTLVGGAGADTLVGGAGADTLVGGSGADRFVVAGSEEPAQVDTIEDFNPDEGDVVVVAGWKQLPRLEDLQLQQREGQLALMIRDAKSWRPIVRFGALELSLVELVRRRAIVPRISVNF